MKKHFILLFVLLPFLSIAQPADSRNWVVHDLKILGSVNFGITNRVYYVATNGLDSNDGSFAAPWSNVLVSLGKLTNNSTLQILPGTYRYRTAAPFTPYRTNIFGITNVWINGNGATIYLTNNTTSASDGQGDGLVIGNVQGLRISGIEFIGQYTNTIKLLSACIAFFGTHNENIEIDHCTFRNWTDQVISIGPNAFNTKGVWIHENRFYNCGATNFPSLGTFVPDGTCISGFFYSDIVVANNYTSNCLRFFEFEPAGRAVETTKFKNFIVRDNICEDQRGIWLYIAQDFSGQSSVENVQIERNIVTWRTDEVNIGQEGTSFFVGLTGISNAIIADNIFDLRIRPASLNGFMTISAGLGTPTRRIQIINNQIIATNLGDYAIIIGNDANQEKIDSVIIKNNLIQGCKRAIGFGAYSGSIQNNDFYLCPGANAAVINLVNGTGDQLGYYGMTTNVSITGNNLFSVAAGAIANTDCYWLILDGSRQVDHINFCDNNDFVGIYPARLIDFSAYAAGTPQNIFLRHNDTYGAAPGGAVVAGPGSTYTTIAGGAGTTFFVKESGISTTGGWIGK